MNRVVFVALVFFVRSTSASAFVSQEKTSIIQTFQSPIDENWNERPGIDQKSLLIIFDTTGSMATDLAQLKQGALDIVNNFASRKDQPIYNYVLSLFNDPEVIDPIVTRNFSIISSTLNAVRVNGGGDCPELAIEGLMNAIDSGLQKSPAFLFSDASAKDYDKYDLAAALIQRKQTTVNFLTTGFCDGTNTPEFKVYTKIARISGGQVFRLERDSVRDVLVATSGALESDFVSLTSFESESAGSTVLKIVIDESVARISVTLTGSNARFIIKDASGVVVPPPSSKALNENFSSDNIQITTFDATSSEYSIEASAHSDYVLRVGGFSELKFDFGFSKRVPSTITDTYFRPLINEKTVLSIYVSNLSLIKDLEAVTIVPAESASDFKEFKVSLKKDSRGFYVTDPFDPPTKMFRLQIRGYDPKDNVIDRLISTGIVATSGIEPAVEIDFERLSAPEKGKLTLQCKVKSLTNVKIQWKYEEELLQEKTFPESVNYLLDLESFSQEKVGNYTCFAENDLGNASTTVSVSLCSIDEDPTCKNFAVTGEISKFLLMLISSIIVLKFLML